MKIRIRITNLLLKLLISEAVIEETDIEVYRYAAEVFWMLVFPFIIMFPISLVLGISYEGYLLLIPFSMLRRVCVGFHFDNENVCYFFSTLYLFGITIIGLQIESVIMMVVIAIFSTISLIIHSNYLSRLRGKSLDKPALIAVTLSVLFFVVVSLSFDKRNVTKWISLGIAMTAALQFPLLIKQKLSFRSNKLSNRVR